MRYFTPRRYSAALAVVVLCAAFKVLAGRIWAFALSLTGKAIVPHVFHMSIRKMTKCVPTFLCILLCPHSVHANP